MMIRRLRKWWLYWKYGLCQVHVTLRPHVSVCPDCGGTKEKPLVAEYVNGPWHEHGLGCDVRPCCKPCTNLFHSSAEQGTAGGSVHVDGVVTEIFRIIAKHGRVPVLVMRAINNHTADLRRQLAEKDEQAAKLNRDFQSWLAKFECGELDSEQLKEAEKKLAERDAVIEKVREMSMAGCSSNPRSLGIAINAISKLMLETAPSTILESVRQRCVLCGDLADHKCGIGHSCGMCCAMWGSTADIDDGRLYAWIERIFNYHASAIRQNPEAETNSLNSSAPNNVKPGPKPTI